MTHFWLEFNAGCRLIHGRQFGWCDDPREGASAGEEGVPGRLAAGIPGFDLDLDENPGLVFQFFRGILRGCAQGGQKYKGAQGGSGQPGDTCSNCIFLLKPHHGAGYACQLTRAPRNDLDGGVDEIDEKGHGDGIRM
ncbi:MAG TPA: hypothetical protein VHE54_15735 [Puia sp.]|nr:hypothetical protein [Puia sp.]